ncbi:MAG: STAS domain-containing protein [Planctomycetota bacterium]|nr:STAS domain-containing protein [Planctomycetota bacterium]
MSEHEFKVEQVEVGGAAVYRMRGPLGDSHKHHEFHRTFVDAMASHPAVVVFNLQGVEHLFSTGIGILANCFTTMKSAGKSLRLCNLSPHVLQLLTLTGVVPLLKPFATEAEALAAK